jgi:hypothetical protein
MNMVSKSKAWLVLRDGSGSEKRSPLDRPVTCIGRHPSNDVVVQGDQAVTVSSYHLEIRREGGRYRIVDRASTNGTYVNGARVFDALLEAGSVIRLGPHGPEFLFEPEWIAAPVIDETVVLQTHDTEIAGFDGSAASSAAAETTKPSALDDTQEALVAEAVEQMRSARRRGQADQTVTILRQVLQTGIQRSSRRMKWIVSGLVGVLIATAAYGSWAIRDLRQQKSDIDAQILEIEARLRQGGQDAAEIEVLIARLRQYQERARALQSSLFYQFTPQGRERIFIQREIETLLSEFGATEYNVPPEFVEHVHEHVLHYQGPDRPHMERALGRASGQLDRMRTLFEQDHLPGDLAYMVLVESAFINGRTSEADAAGLWQFQAETARQFGLKVTA